MPAVDSLAPRSFQVAAASSSVTGGEDTVTQTSQSAQIEIRQQSMTASDDDHCQQSIIQQSIFNIRPQETK